ncbi:MAG TPA: hypothetical protein VGJ79_10655 [Candidatus Dormibacteraeota bacterium]
MAVLAVLACGAAIVSDETNWRFWGRHTLLAGLVVSVIVVLLTVAVVNEVLERRSRERWSILAQYVMFELVRSARMIWSGILEVAGLLPTEPNQQAWGAAGAQVVRDTPRLSASLRAIVDDPEGRGRLHDEVAFLAEHADEVLGRWAAVMLNAAPYAEVLDRHVELAGDIAWIAGLLDTSHPPVDFRRQRRARSSPAVQIEGEASGDWLADRIVVITQLAERLDQGTLEVALQIVPVQWWRERLGTGAPPSPA